jgi:hypothetical protein
MMLTIVRMIATMGLDACGAGAASSVEWIIPAKAVLESAHASATAIAKRFIFLFLLLGSEDARLLVTETE